MFTKNIKDTFTKNLLDAVSGVLGEAKKKKCSESCECEACMKEKGEKEEAKEGYIPTQRNLTARDNETIGKLAALMKKEREAKEKKEPLGVKTEEVEEIEEKRGLWDNIHAKRERIKHGSGERMRKPGSKGAPTAADFKASQTEEVQIDELSDATLKSYSRKALDQSKTLTGDQKVKRQVGARNAIDRLGNNTLAKEEVEINEISKKTAIKAYAKRNAKAFNDGDYDDEAEKDYNKLDKQAGRIKRKFGAATLNKAGHAAHKEIFGEVAPPGAKYERMVKHIKKAYAKDGKLTDKEKSIAYATAWKAKNEETEIEENWIVKKGTEVVSTHKSKDEADVKAMKHPLYKVYAKEEVEIEEAVGDITVKKLSPDEAFKKHTGQMTKKTSVPKDPKTGKTLYQKVTSEEVEELDEALDSMSDARIKYHATKNFPHGKYSSKEIDAEHKRRMKAVPNYHTVKASLGEEAEQIDELSKDTLKSYMDKKKVPSGTVVANTNDKDSMRKYTNRVVGGVRAAKRLMTKEEAEQIDEISREALGSYVVNAAKDMAQHGVTAGLKIGGQEDSKKNFKKMANREKGINTAVSRLTQEEQDFIDALNNDLFDEITLSELSNDTLKSYVGKAQKSYDKSAKQDERAQRAGDRAVKKHGEFSQQADDAYAKAAQPQRNMEKRYAGLKMAAKKIKEEADTLDEARGRPKKNAGKDFTVNPRTKEKLYHDNPEHMAKIEKLQKHGVIAKPKTEASQHIINQLSKAKTSMRGGETIHFTHGESQHVSGTHAAKLLDKYHGMKPDEKEAFQKKIGHSHAKLKSEL